MEVVPALLVIQADISEMSNASDEEIILRVQAGETRLFGLIFERHYHRIEQLLRQTGLSEGDLEDALADTFIRAFERIHSFDPHCGTRYRSYLYSIARHRAVDYQRKRGRTPESQTLEDLPFEPSDAKNEPLMTALHQSDVQRIRRAMQALNTSDRQIVCLSYDHELTSREIMEVMGKPSVTAVTTHLYKALKRLRSLVLSPDDLPTCRAPEAAAMQIERAEAPR